MTDKQKNVPYRRFKEFENADAWEQRKFEDLANRISKSSEETGLPQIEYDDIISGRGILNKNIFVKANKKTGVEFQNGDILFGKLRPYLKNWFLSNFKGIAVGDWWVLRSTEVVKNNFLYYLIQSEKYQNVANLSSGTKMPRSDWKLVSQTNFRIPTGYIEQEKIGKLFSDLDHLITLHQQQLKKLKNLKQAYLNEMFV